MLIDANPLARQRARAEMIDIARNIGIFRVADFGQHFGQHQHAVAIELAAVEVDQLAAHAGFVFLQHFARAAVEFDAVAVRRDMAARYHQRGHPARECIKRHRRGGHIAAEHRLAAHIAHGARARGQDARRTGPQVTRQRHFIAPIQTGGRKFALFGHEAQEPGSIAITHPVGHRRNQPACAARAKGDAAFQHQVFHGYGHRAPFGPNQRRI